MVNPPAEKRIGKLRSLRFSYFAYRDQTVRYFHKRQPYKDDNAKYKEHPMSAYTSQQQAAEKTTDR